MAVATDTLMAAEAKDREETIMALISTHASFLIDSVGASKCRGL
jgi:hypothetical protein